MLKNVSVNDLHNNTLLKIKKITFNIKKISVKKNTVNINKLKLNNAVINLKKYKNEKSFNFQFLIDYFSLQDTSTTNKEWKIALRTLNIVNSNLVYKDQNKPLKNKGIDFNNINISKLDLKIKDILVHNDTISANIKNLSFKEHKGFVLNKLNTIAKITNEKITIEDFNINTPLTDIALNLTLDYKNFDAFNDFINKVHFVSKIKSANINSKDIAYFISDIYGMNNKINISGEIKGKVNNLKARNFKLIFGNSTQLIGDFNFTGLPDIEETFMHLNIKKFITTQQDIKSITLPCDNGIEKHINIPDNFAMLKNIKINGSLTGFYNDFVSYGDFYTNIGKISTDIALKRNPKNPDYNAIKYKGKISTDNFNIGKLFSSENTLGKISLNAIVSGKGWTKNTVDIDINGTISSIDIKNYNYNNIKIKGNLTHNKFDGQINIIDKNINMNTVGTIDYSKDIPAFNISSVINNANLNKLNLLKRDSVSELSSSLTFNFKGNKIDNLQGTVKIDSTTYKQGKETYNFKELLLSNTISKSNYKTIKLNSDYIDADINGNFTLTDFKPVFCRLLNKYLPSLNKNNLSEADDSTKIRHLEIDYNINFKNTTLISKLLFPQLKIAPNSHIKGTYNSVTDLLIINGNSSDIEFARNKFKDFYINGKTTKNALSLNIGCKCLPLSDSIIIDNVELKTIIHNDSIAYDLVWNNNKQIHNNSGDIKGFASFIENYKIKLKLLDSKIVFNDSAWVVSKNNYIILDTSSVFINNLAFVSSTQQIKIDGTASKLLNDKSNKLNISFNNFNLSVFDILANKRDYDFDGILNGNLSLMDLYNSPYFVSDLKIYNIGFNDTKLGDAVIQSSWDNNKKAISVDVNIIYTGNIGTNKPLAVKGFYYPNRDNNNFDFDVTLKNLRVKTFAKYLSDFTSDFRGIATGKIKLTGSPRNIDINGKIKLLKTHIKIDYMNTVYTFSHEIDVKKNCFVFDNLIVNDKYGNTAICNGKIYHNNFKQWKIDLNFRPDKLLCLNTNISQNDMFYGKAFTSGFAKIYGPAGNITMDISTKTEKGTKIFIPLTYTEEVSENNFVTFVSKDTTKTKKIYETKSSNICLNMDIEITPEAKTQIIFDSKIGDIMKARGNGNLKFEINTHGDFNMFGDYVIEQGDYLFTLKNIINKHFEVEKGGLISWNGSPYDATVNLNAVYNLQTSLSNILDDTSEIYKKRIPVQCKFNMKNKLMNPDITFDIGLPKSDEETKEKLKNTLYLNDKDVNQQQMNKQIFALLMLNRFLKESKEGSSIGSEYASAGTTNSSELFSNQMSNWLSQISNDFDVGINYRPGDEISDKEVQVALSTQLFNDRVLINGNVENSTSQNTSNIVGDVNVEYKITEQGKFRIKAFNKANNNNDILNINAPYTQGVGIFYHKDFDSLKELFSKKK